LIDSVIATVVSETVTEELAFSVEAAGVIAPGANVPVGACPLEAVWGSAVPWDGFCPAPGFVADFWLANWAKRSPNVFPFGADPLEETEPFPKVTLVLSPGLENNEFKSSLICFTNPTFC
jgi:hypothetical protein